MEKHNDTKENTEESKKKKNSIKLIKLN